MKSLCAGDRIPSTGGLRALMAMICVGWVLVSAVAGQTTARSGSDSFLDGLLARRLFGLAEVHCRGEVEKAKTKRAKAEAANDLARVYAEWATQSSPATRDARYRQAREVLKDHATGNARELSTVLVERQDALVELAWAQLLLQEAEVVGKPEPLREAARTSLRDAIDTLDRLVPRVVDAVAQSTTSRSPSPELSADELQILEHDLRYRLAVARLYQGRSYPPKSDDRVNSLSQSVEEFQRLAEVVHPLQWDCRLYQVEALRELEKLDAAAEQLGKLLAAGPPPEMLFRGQLEQARLALARGNVVEARRLLANPPKADIAPPLAAQWDDTLLSALLAASRSETNGAEAARLQQQAAELVRQSGTRYGPFWLRRGEARLGHFVAAGPPTDDLGLLSSAAQSYYRSEKADEALAAFDRAHKEALRQRSPDRAFEFAFAAATIEHERKRFRDAVDRYRALSLAHPSHAQAAEAHLLAAFDAAQFARTQSPPRLDEYLALLSEHVEKWPKSPTADQAWFWLAEMRRQQGRYPEAVAAYQSIRPSSKLVASAIEPLAGAYANWLDSITNDARRKESVAREGAEHFSRLVRDAGTSEQQLLTPWQRAAVLESARLRLLIDAGRQQAEAQIAEALRRNPSAPPPWRAAAHAMLARAIAPVPDRFREAREAITASSGAPTAALVELFDSLVELEATPGPHGRGVAELTLMTAALLEPNAAELNDAMKRKLNVGTAEALSALDRRDEALKIYRQLAETEPNNGEIQAAYASLLLNSDAPNSLRAALVKWREIERRTRAGSPQWFEAKYSQALAYERLGEKERAARIVKLAEVLHPDLGGSQQKARFQELLKRCEPR